MKIETRDMVPESAPEPEATPTVSRSQYGRAGIAIVLACAMLMALRWAVMVTNDNGRQVSGTLTTLQNRIEQPNLAADPFSEEHLGKMKAHRSSSSGPTLEPVENR